MRNNKYGKMTKLNKINKGTDPLNPLLSAQPNTNGHFALQRAISSNRPLSIYLTILQLTLTFQDRLPHSLLLPLRASSTRMSTLSFTPCQRIAGVCILPLNPLSIPSRPKGINLGRSTFLRKEERDEMRSEEEKALWSNKSGRNGTCEVSKRGCSEQ
ncbi:hypothetical protein NPIL_307391 [Nephila pilipes]|uniref:Uncharacterized protein n=1 Tax=Nephila pilipes TaxID=299642 RepID=A0A8X6J0C7_NEPPI|nr:hypothetical protein NPIL_307391 [Nephila pilipes]